MTDKQSLLEANSGPLVSVIMNCYNGEKYLREAIDSVYAQTYQNWEIIFWDNVSKDQSAEIAKAYDKRLKYFCGEKLIKLYAARRLAIEKASGEYLAFLDVDDWWEPNKLIKQIQAVFDFNISLVYSNYYFENSSKDKKTIIKGPQFGKNKVAFNEISSKYTVGLLTLLINKQSYDKIGGFNEKYHIIGDYDLVLRLSHDLEVFGIDEPLAHYRWHENNESGKNLLLQIEETENMLMEYYKRNIYPEVGLKNIKYNLLYNKISLLLNQGNRRLAFKYLFSIQRKSLFLKALIKFFMTQKIITFFTH